MTVDYLVKFDAPAHYHIAVLGKLDKDFLDLAVTSGPKEETHQERIITTIRVCVRDQAQLSGILNILYDSHHTILRVECTNPD